MKKAQGTQLKMFESENTILKEGKVGKNISSDIKSRRLKIQYGNYANSYRRFAVIRLAGHWLSKFDFHVGDIIHLQIVKGSIGITKVTPEN